MFVLSLLAMPVSAQSDSAFYDAGRDAGASSDEAAGLSTALRFVAPSQEAKLLAQDALQGQIGFSVALWNDRAIVGMSAADVGRGAAYIFIRLGDSWVPEARLVAADASEFDRFGWAVSLSSDRALVSAIGANSRGANSGAAYVFVRSGSTWFQEAKVAASDGARDDQFGRADSLFDDRAIIGTAYDDDNGPQSGSAYVFLRNGSFWGQEAKLVAWDGAADDQFGLSVSLSGERALVGAHLDDDLGSESGSAYVFARSGGTWTQEAKLKAADGGADDTFGFSVSLSGARALIGSHLNDDGGTNRGAAYVFSRVSDAWVQEAKLLANDGSIFDDFGYSVSLSGNRALIGARLDDDMGGNSGSAYVFVRSGAVWMQESKIVPADGMQNDHFATKVSLSGERALIGAPFDDDVRTDGGAAHIYGGVRTVGIGDDASSGVTLLAPVPNPAVERATLTFTVDVPQAVRATVVDALGRHVAVAFDGLVTSADDIVVETGALAPGVYVVRVMGETFTLTRRLTVVR